MWEPQSDFTVHVTSQSIDQCNSWLLVSLSNAADALRLAEEIWRRCRLRKETEHLREDGTSGPTRWYDLLTLSCSIQEPMSLPTSGADLLILNSSPGELSATARTSGESNSWCLSVSLTMSFPTFSDVLLQPPHYVDVYVLLQVHLGDHTIDNSTWGHSMLSEFSDSL